MKPWIFDTHGIWADIIKFVSYQNNSTLLTRSVQFIWVPEQAP
jgi:hypothetical protein